MELNCYDRKRLQAICAPVVTGVPQCLTGRDMMRLDDGTIRHYGYHVEHGDFREIYQESRDSGLSWKEFPAPEGSPGACVKSPFSGDWVTALFWDGRVAHDAYAHVLRTLPEKGLYWFRSGNGPDGVFAATRISDRVGQAHRQPLALRQRRRWILPLQFHENYRASAAVLYSDDDGASWTTVEIGSTPRHEPKPPHRGLRWENSGIEPVVAELNDGSLYLLLRTSQDVHYECRSFDAGASWTEPVPSRFYSTLTMPGLLHLRDGRLLAIWNNTTPLPELDHFAQTGLNAGECNGGSEDVFTNRDALHAAISEDDGKSWIGFRELILNEERNAGDFRRVGGSEVSLDKSVHQSQALEVEEGKILVALGQHTASARLLLFDPAFLYEKSRRDDFADGLRNWSVHQYLKSPSGNFRGTGGHCAWNRRPGASLVPDPECWHREVMQIARHPDERLLFEKEGACWNFPSGKCGRVVLEFHQVAGSAGVQIALTDRWLNPVDPVVENYAQFLFRLNPCGRWCGGFEQAPLDRWYRIEIAFDLTAQTAFLRFPELELPEIRVSQLHATPNGISYCHLQSPAEAADGRGVLIRAIRAEIES